MSERPLRALGLLLASALLAAGCATRNAHFDASRPHHTPEGFRNNHAQIDPDAGGGFWRWQLERWQADLPADAPQRVPAVRTDLAALRANSGQGQGDVTVTWIGHSSALWQVAGLNILLDPHFSERASPVQFVGPKRHTALPFQLADLPRIDIVLLSHNHYDHLDRDTVLALNAQAGGPPLFVVPLGLEQWLQAEGITRSQALDWWDRHTLQAPGGPVQVSLVPSQHWSSRSVVDRNASLWGGFVVQAQAGGKPVSLYYVGDTGYSPDFAEIGRRFGGFDLSLIPVGCYLPRWFMKSQHASADDAVRIHADVRSRLSVGVHWGSFRLCDDPIDSPLDSLPPARRQHGVADEAFVLLGLGETRVVRRGKP
jgi:L-ascorbate metabolism protein UlaG (beta-lactamase superfamily)